VASPDAVLDTVRPFALAPESVAALEAQPLDATWQDAEVVDAAIVDEAQLTLDVRAVAIAAVASPNVVLDAVRPFALAPESVAALEAQPLDATWQDAEVVDAPIVDEAQLTLDVPAVAIAAVASPDAVLDAVRPFALAPESVAALEAQPLDEAWQDAEVGEAAVVDEAQLTLDVRAVAIAAVASPDIVLDSVRPFALAPESIAALEALGVAIANQDAASQQSNVATPDEAQLTIDAPPVRIAELPTVEQAIQPVRRLRLVSPAPPAPDAAAAVPAASAELAARLRPNLQSPQGTEDEAWLAALLEGGLAIDGVTPQLEIVSGEVSPPSADADDPRADLLDAVARQLAIPDASRADAIAVVAAENSDLPAVPSDSGAPATHAEREWLSLAIEALELDLEETRRSAPPIFERDAQRRQNGWAITEEDVPVAVQPALSAEERREIAERLGASYRASRRAAPLASWATRQESPARGAADTAAADDLRPLLETLKVPLPVASVAYASGCRIRRLRVPSKPKCRGTGREPLIIVSRRMLEELRAASEPRGASRPVAAA
jgi:hypothetical protein